ncbi:FMN reductase [Actinorhabdospora filicis]|uniref:FMN reductase n=1 Tax=Actinorhabdospora filicis TaxID=1785913 RepID=A0A9W6SMA4_9ACTN|nr:NAD(P)H-dependent oxidoreductase [Actinorhabdospora filicis]GLZ78392.1 FMN reductase [Actinorhabdospora filicis]
MVSIAVVVGSTRPGRVSRAVADWVLERADGREASYGLLDLADFDLPVYDEPLPAALGKYEGAHTRAWADAVAPYDGYVFVTPEYNHGPTAALKNALDYIYAEWNDKAAGFVGLGAVGGARAVEHLRLVASELRLATVAAQVALTVAGDFPEYPAFAPAASREAELDRVLDQVEAWAKALRVLR